MQDVISIQYRVRGDDDLLELARAGNRDAFNAFVGRHERRVYSLVSSITRGEEDAAAALSRTFVEAHRDLESRDRRKAPRVWLFGHAVRAAFERVHARHADRLAGAPVR